MRVSRAKSAGGTEERYVIVYDRVSIGRCKSLDWTDPLERHIASARAAGLLQHL